MSSLMAVDIGKEIPRKYTARHAPLLILPVTSGQYGYIIHETLLFPSPYINSAFVNISALPGN
jgi:hypothetical protein